MKSKESNSVLKLVRQYEHSIFAYDMRINGIPYARGVANIISNEYQQELRENHCFQ